MRAQRKLATKNPGTKELTKRIRMAFMTKVNRPRERMLMGRVRITKIGFKMALTIPKMTETIMAVTKESTLTPGKI